MGVFHRLEELTACNCGNDMACGVEEKKLREGQFQQEKGKEVSGIVTVESQVKSMTASPLPSSV